MIDTDGEKKIDKLSFDLDTNQMQLEKSLVGNESIQQTSQSGLLLAEYLQNLTQNSDNLKKGNFYLNVTQDNSSNGTRYEVYELMDLDSKEEDRQVENPAPTGESDLTQVLKESTILYQKKDKDGNSYLEAKRTNLDDDVQTSLKFQLNESVPQLLSTSMNIHQGRNETYDADVDTDSDSSPYVPEDDSEESGQNLGLHDSTQNRAHQDLDRKEKSREVFTVDDAIDVLVRESASTMNQFVIRTRQENQQDIVEKVERDGLGQPKVTDRFVIDKPEGLSAINKDLP